MKLIDEINKFRINLMNAINGYTVVKVLYMLGMVFTYLLNQSPRHLIWQPFT